MEFKEFIKSSYYIGRRKGIFFSKEKNNSRIAYYKQFIRENILDVCNNLKKSFDYGNCPVCHSPIMVDGVDFSLGTNELLKTKGKPNFREIIKSGENKIYVFVYRQVIRKPQLRTYYFVNGHLIFYENYFEFPDEEMCEMVRELLNKKYQVNCPCDCNEMVFRDENDNYLYFRDATFISIKYFNSKNFVSTVDHQTEPVVKKNKQELICSRIYECV